MAPKPSATVTPAATYRKMSRADRTDGASSEASLSALAAWAQRFGAVLVSEDNTDEQGRPRTYVRAVFEFFGVEVTAYAFIPVTATGT